MSAGESEALFSRRGLFESALARIPSDASLCSPADELPWEALADLYAAADGVRGIGLAKLTKFLHKKRPELIPMLDSVVEGYLRSVGVIPSRREGIGGVAVALTRSYKIECRILDIFTWAYTGQTSPPWAPDPPAVPPRDSQEAERLATEVGVSADGDAHIALQAVLEALGQRASSSRPTLVAGSSVVA